MLATEQQLDLPQEAINAFAPFELFAKVMLDAYAIIDTTGKIVKANQLFCQLVEKKAKQVLKSENMDQLLKFYIKAEHLSAAKLLNFKDPTRIDEVRGENDSRNDLNLIVGAYPLTSDTTHTTVGAFILIRDVTAEKNLHDKYKTTKTDSITDQLTGLFTRRYFEDYLHLKQHTFLNEESRHLVGKISLILIDIDFFKKVNDVYGHQAGDHVLKIMGALLQSRLRKSDIPCRYGGEEFLVILGDTQLANSIGVAEKIRLLVEQTEINFEGTKIPVTISCGVTEIEFGKEDYHDSIKRADLALYQSKREGRNRVTIHTGIGGELKPAIPVIPV